MKCKACGKEFSVEIEGRKFVFCPYCGDKQILVSDKSKSLKELQYAAKKDPSKNWELAEKIYNTVIVEHDYSGKRSDFARELGMSPASLSNYIRAYEFAKEEDIDKSKMAFTNAARLSSCKNLDLVKDVLNDFYHKDIYTASLHEIKAAVADVNRTEKDNPFNFFG